MGQRVTIEDVLKQASTYIHNNHSLEIIQRAYDVANKQHEGQFRKSGDPYVQHPLEVAYILTTLNTGPNTIAAGLLHDVLEDTDITKTELANAFNEDIANIVDGVTKISKLKYMTKEKALAHNHEKLLLAMAKDIRVIVVKLVDRLHNMRTIEFHDPVKQKRIAQETLDLYSPLAHRLGMYRLKAELEDLSFKVLDYDEYKAIVEAVGEKKAEREQDMELMKESIKEQLDTYQIKNYEIKGRIKNIYSIYKKIVTKNKSIDDIFDLLALRVIVNSVGECYQILGMIHSKWTPIPMRFKDYIAVPKPNLYQSLHTTVVGVGGKIFEIQIRTFQMDEVAELGIAAHWAYKENAGYSPEKEQLEITNKLKWYRDLSTYVEESESEDPLDNIIEDIFSANVYVFTPKGDVIDLPSGATPLDFAFKIHSNIGLKTVGAIVNGKIVPLSYKLKTGDVVSIKTNNSCPGPTSAWLKNVKTSHAKTKIKAFLNKQKREEYIQRGFEELETVAKQYNYDIKELTDKKAAELFGYRSVKTVEDLYREIGKGNLSALAAINKILGLTDTKLSDEVALQQYSEDTSNVRIRRSQNGYGIIVEGLDKAQIKLGNCCQPVLGDEIVGFISRGNGIIVHREECPNVHNSEVERLINLSWDPNFKGRVFDTTLKILSMDKRNGVADMINALNSSSVTIASVSSTKNAAGECVTKFKLQVANLHDLNMAILSLQKLSDIYSIERVFK